MMPLTIDQQQLVLRHLERKQTGTLCQICKKGELKVHPEMVCTPLAESSRGEIKIYARDVVQHKNNHTRIRTVPLKSLASY